MTKPNWSNAFKSMRVLVNDVSEQILEQPIDQFVEWYEINDCLVKESCTPIEAMKLISGISQGVMLVAGRRREFTGMITLTPLYRAVAADRTDVKVKDLCVLRSNIIEIGNEDTVKSALTSFYKHDFKRLLVFDKDNTAKFGVLRQSVLMKWLIEQLLLESETRA
jgi:predicted transcriptional regulator